MSDDVQLLAAHFGLLECAIAQTDVDPAVKELARDLAAALRLSAGWPPDASDEAPDAEMATPSAAPPAPEPEAILPEEALAFVAITGANAWRAEFMLAQLWCVDRAVRAARYARIREGLRLDHPLAICHAPGSAVTNAVQLGAVPADLLYDLACKPSETEVGGVDFCILRAPAGGEAVLHVVQVKLGASKLFLGDAGSKRRNSVYQIVDWMRERGAVLCQRFEAAYGLRVRPQYALCTSRHVSAPAVAWLAAEGVTLLDRSNLWAAWPDRVRAWAAGGSVPDCPRPPAWLAAGAAPPK